MNIYFLLFRFDEKEKEAAKSFRLELSRSLRGYNVYFVDFDLFFERCIFGDDRSELIQGPPNNKSCIVILYTQRNREISLSTHQLYIEVDFNFFSNGSISGLKLKLLARACRRMSALSGKIYRNYIHSPFILPWRNFLSRDFDNAMSFIQENWLKEEAVFEKEEVVFERSVLRSFGGLLDCVENKLKNLRRPRRQKRGSDHGRPYVDDRGFEFRFSANAQHGAMPVNREPHNNICVLNGLYRLGCRINSAHHYDVTGGKRGKIVGQEMFDCHAPCPESVHANYSNIWSNDFRIDR